MSSPVDRQSEAGDPGRLTYEQLTSSHAPVLFPYLQEAALYRFIPQEPPDSVAALTARFELLASRRSPDGKDLWLNWVMRQRDTGNYVGMLEATILPDQSATIAYFVFVRYQRQGYAREGVAWLLDLLFDHHEIRIAAAEIDTRNRASIALVETLGFACVSKHIEVDFFKGATSDEYRYELRRRPLRNSSCQ